MTRALVIAGLCLVVARAAADDDPQPASQGSDTGSGSSDPDLRDVLEQAPAPPEPDAPEPPTGTVRLGIYQDSDHTRVLRALATLAKTYDRWQAGGSFDVDTVTSAAVDVRSSPALSTVDIVTTASGRSSSSGGEMTDTR